MIDTLRTTYLNIKNLFKIHWDSSLYFRIAFSLVMAMLAMATLFGAVAGITIYYSIARHESSELKSRLDRVTSEIENKINTISSDGENLAKNTLITNALVDTYGRDAYLVPFLKSHKNENGVAPHVISLHDFKGTVIASNSSKLHSYDDKALLDTIVEKGRPLARIEDHENAGDNHLVIFNPVKYQATGTTEGFLIVDVSMKDIAKLLLQKDPSTSASIYQKNRLILKNGRNSGASMSRKLKLIGAASELDITVEVRMPQRLTILWFVFAILVVSGPLFWFIVKISSGISNNLTSRLFSLNEAAQNISESGVPDKKVSITGSDEIGHLADAFNRMIDQLSESYDSLEGRVEERTRLLAEANKTLTKEVESRLEAENRLKELNENLEKTIQHEIEQHQEKERMLIQQNRLAAMGEMINNIAHQWRQPLNNVGLIVQGLQTEFESGTLSPDSFRQDVENCMTSIQYMSKTIDDFRHFFRPDKEKHIFHIKDTLTTVYSLIQPTLTNYRIELRIIDDNPKPVLGYANEFGQVMMNLINNTKDAVFERNTVNPYIEIHCFEEGERVIVAVRDNAGGIDESLIDKVFDPYFTTKFQTQGTGIGLYMSKIIIEKNMGGILSVRNSGDGTEFRIEI